MPTVANILNDPTRGLIPYLERKLEEDWNRFQLRSWTFFDTEDNSSGFRLRESPTQHVEFDRLIKSWTITLGKVITMDDPTLSQIAGGTLSEQMDDLIMHWANGVCPWLTTLPGQSSAIPRITGMNDIEQNSGISSDNAGAWNIFVVREFEFSYFMDYEAC